MKANARSPALPITCLLVFAIAIRIVFSFSIRPDVSPDTESYYALIPHFLSFDFSGYTGFRVPGYTIFVLLFTGENQHLVWLIQSVIAIGTTLLLFWICFVSTANASLALLSGILHTIAINQLAFEASISSEILATFLVVLSVALFISSIRAPQRIGYYAAVGIVTALAALTRPMFIYLGPLLAILALIYSSNTRIAAALGGGFLAVILGWMLFNKVTIGYFGLQTSQGYGIMNHTGKFIEKAGDEYAVVRDIYLKYREENIRKTGSQVVTIFLARDELREKTGLSEHSLAQLLSKLSFELIINNPWLYVRSVVPAWVDFWRIRNESDNVSFEPAGRDVILAIWSVLRWFLMAINFLSILAIAFVFVRDTSRRFTGHIGLSPSLVVASVVGVASVLQALAEYGAGSRYAVPTQSLGWLLVVLVAWELWRYYKDRLGPRTMGYWVRS